MTGDDTRFASAAFVQINTECELLTGDALQSLMRHRSYSTTQRYINMAGQLNRSVERLHVPDALQTCKLRYKLITTSALQFLGQFAGASIDQRLADAGGRRVDEVSSAAKLLV